MSLDYSLRLKHFILIGLGAAIYAFGFVYFYMANQVAASGIAGLTLIL